MGQSWRTDGRVYRLGIPTTDLTAYMGVILPTRQQQSGGILWGSLEDPTTKST